MSFGAFVRELNGSRVEGELVKTFFYSLIASALTLGILYAVKLRAIAGVGEKYGLFLFFAALSYAVILPSVRQVRAYRELPCMAGMMVGMTTGMIAGFLGGFYAAATNGMFIGSVFGMALGIALGSWNGRCCGIMGMMEGLMAGFMGGLMGAMTAFMLLNDHLRATAVIVFIIGATIAIGLQYLVYREMRESERQLKEDHFIIVLLSIIFTAATAWIMVFGPRSAVLGG